MSDLIYIMGIGSISFIFGLKVTSTRPRGRADMTTKACDRPWRVDVV